MGGQESHTFLLNLLNYEISKDTFFRPNIRLLSGRVGAVAVPAPDDLTCEGG